MKKHKKSMMYCLGAFGLHFAITLSNVSNESMQIFSGFMMLFWLIISLDERRSDSVNTENNVNVNKIGDIDSEEVLKIVSEGIKKGRLNISTVINNSVNE